MRKSNQQTIGQVIQQYLKENNLEKKFKRSHIIGSWEIIMGKVVANHTKSIVFNDKTLFLELDSPGLRNELSYRKAELIKKINTEAGEEIIKEIIFK